MSTVSENLGLMDEGLGGNTPDVEADPSGFVLFDHGGFQAELTRTNSRDIAPGTGSDYNEIKVIIRHTHFLLRGSSAYLEQRPEGLLDHIFQIPQESRPDGPVDRPVVAGEGHPHHPFDNDLVIIGHHRFLLRLAEGQNGRSRGIDDGGKLFDAVVSQVADREGRARVLLGFEAA
jgi:hypothetical protein